MRFPIALTFALIAANAIAGPDYTELKTTLDSGTEVREYLTVDGRVFAVSWAGPSLPDLRAILGPHFQTLLNHERLRRPGARSPLHVQQDGVVIFMAGRMGAFEGRAWLPALLPTGFKTTDLR
ncbi:MAG: hypothetical protein JWQ33_2301 [Ramlibacter sp.]|nr:hypothetical protein [Ramlibacter sp.]